MRNSFLEPYIGDRLATLTPILDFETAKLRCDPVLLLLPLRYVRAMPLHREPAPLAGLSILVADASGRAEDHLATLRQAGATVRGPAASANYIDAVLADGPVDAAIVDVGAKDEAIFVAADRLAALHCRFLFVFEGDSTEIPYRFWEIPLVAPPLDPDRIVQDIRTMLDGGMVR